MIWKHFESNDKQHAAIYESINVSHKKHHRWITLEVELDCITAGPYIKLTVIISVSLINRTVLGMAAEHSQLYQREKHPKKQTKPPSFDL